MEESFPVYTRVFGLYIEQFHVLYEISMVLIFKKQLGNLFNHIQ